MSAVATSLRQAWPLTWLRTLPQALGSLACRRRVLLSGTPLQNHLVRLDACSAPAL